MSHKLASKKYMEFSKEVERQSRYIKLPFALPSEIQKSKEELIILDARSELAYKSFCRLHPNNS